MDPILNIVGGKRFPNLQSIECIRLGQLSFKLSDNEHAEKMRDNQYKIYSILLAISQSFILYYYLFIYLFILFYFYFYFILFYFILFYFILFYFYFILFLFY